MISCCVYKPLWNEHGIWMVANPNSFLLLFVLGYLKRAELRSNVNFTPPSINVLLKGFVLCLHPLPLVRNDYIVSGVEVLFAKETPSIAPIIAYPFQMCNFGCVAGVLIGFVSQSIWFWRVQQQLLGHRLDPCCSSREAKSLEVRFDIIHSRSLKAPRIWIALEEDCKDGPCAICRGLVQEDAGDEHFKLQTINGCQSEETIINQPGLEHTTPPTTSRAPWFAAKVRTSGAMAGSVHKVSCFGMLRA